MTNKLNFLIPLAGLLILISCKNNNSNQNTTSTPEPEVLEETIIEEVPTVSDLDFEGAIEAFSNKEFALSASFIDDAIKDIQDESKDMDSAVKEKVDLSVVALQRLSERIKKEEIKDIATLERAFSEAEMLIAHDYMVFSDIYFVGNPEKSKSSAQSAVDKIDNAINKLEGEAKEEAKSLKAEIKESLKKGDEKANKIGNAAGEKIDKLADWLTKHKKELK